MLLLYRLVDNLRNDMPSPWLEVILALAAVLCGTIIGLERQQRDKPAGLRMLILVCLGSAVFTMVSFVFTTTTGDSGRVAAQIVTGIGFLGAGAIMHSRTSVSGMTTAATIWVTAAIGMTVGAGLPLAGLGLSLLVRFILASILGWEIRHLGGMRSVTVNITFDPDHGKTEIRLNRLRDDFWMAGQRVGLPKSADGLDRARMEVKLPQRHLNEFLEALAALHAIREIHVGP